MIDLGNCPMLMSAAGGRLKYCSRIFTIASIVALIHIGSGLVLLVSGLPKITTPLSLLSSLVHEEALLIAILVAAGVAAMLPQLRRFPLMVSICLILPQQILLGLHLASALTAVISGRYPDGYVPDGGALFILVDQAWLIGVVVWHTVEFSHLVIHTRK